MWLRVEAGASIRVTGSPSSRLETLPVGSSVEIAARLTGMVELGWDAAGAVYYGERVQLLVSDVDVAR